MPNECVYYVFSFLDVRTLLRIASVCKLWASLAEDNRLWFRHYKILQDCASLYCQDLFYKNVFKHRYYYDDKFSKCIKINAINRTISRSAFNSSYFTLNAHAINEPIINILKYNNVIYIIIEEVKGGFYFFRKLDFRKLPGKILKPYVLAADIATTLDSLHTGYYICSFVLPRSHLELLEDLVQTDFSISNENDMVKSYKIMFDKIGYENGQQTTFPLFNDLRPISSTFYNVVDASEWRIKSAPSYGCSIF